jgi:branched-chain amino acid transport system substrate-binding protein
VTVRTIQTPQRGREVPSWRRLVAVAVLGVLALGVAACGDDDDDDVSSDTTATGDTEPASALAGETIRIGVPIDLTGGPVGQVGERERQGIELAAQEAEDTAFLGEDVEIELIVEDTKSDPAQAPIAVNKLIHEDEVNAIVGFSYTVVALAGIPILEQEKVPTVAVGVSAPAVTEQGEYIYRGGWPVYHRLIQNYGDDALEALGIESGAKAAIINQSDCEPCVPFFDAWQVVFDDAGVDLAATEHVVTGDTDYSAQVTAVTGTNPDVVIVDVAAGLEGQVTNALRDAGYDGQIIGELGHGSADVQTLIGENGVGDAWLSGYFADDTDGRNPEFVELYEAEHGATPDQFNAAGYDAMWLVLRAIDEAQSVERADIASVLKEWSTSGATITGAMGDCTMNDVGDLECPAALLRIKAVGEIEQLET